MKYPRISGGILEQSIEDKNRVGIGFSYQPAKQHKLAESFPWNRFLGFLNVYKNSGSVKISKDDVNGFSFTSDIYFMVVL
jgi:hypothetical protein